MANLATSVGRLRLKNPTMLASGVRGDTGESLLQVAEAGAAALVTRSIGRNPVNGSPGPSLVQLEHGLLTADGYANPGVDAFAGEMQVAAQGGVPLIGSIFADDVESFGPLARAMELHGAHALELNLGYPHPQRGAEEIASDADLVGRITAEVKRAVKIPVLVKLSAMVRDLAAIAQSVEAAGGDGITAILRVKGMSVAPEVARPVLPGKIGGLSGPLLKPLGLRSVWTIYEAVDLPIIGVGGVRTGLDAAEYLMAGARAVQIGSGVHYRGLDVFEGVCQELVAFMDGHGYPGIEDLVGVAHE